MNVPLRKLIQVSNDVIPKPLTEGDQVYSNFDHEFQLTEKQVKTSGCYHHHAGWNFSANVWWNEKRQKFVEEVWQHRRIVAIITGDTLEQVIRETCSQYGSG